MTDQRGGEEAEDTVQIEGGWRLWKWFCLRSAGFPFEPLLGLATPAVREAADRALAEEARVVAITDEALAAIQGELAHGAIDPKVAKKWMKGLRAGRVPEGLPPAMATTLAAAQAELARATVEALAVIGSPETIAPLRAAVADPRFAEALVWQNRAAFANAVVPLLNPAFADGPSRLRRIAMVAVSYLQRYCAKNDSIGFFGPIGWGRFDPSAAPLRSLPAPSLLERRTVYFEYWCIDALAARLSEDPELRRAARPRPAPELRLEGETLIDGERRLPLPTEYVRALALCDAERTAAEVVDLLLRDEELALDEEQAWGLLEELAAQRALYFRFELPPAGAHPEEELRSQLLRIVDEETRARALAPLDQLEEARRSVAAAAGDSARLDPALERCEQLMEVLTGVAGKRGEGATYAGRTPLFEDCRRAGEVTLGGELLHEIGPPLALILESARWYGAQVAARYRVAFTEVHARLAAASGSAAVDYLRFFHEVLPLFPGGAAPGSIVGEVLAQLQSRWAALLDPSTGSPIFRSVAELSAGVAEAFPPSRPGWPGARHHSPDVLIAARDAAAVERGDYLLVLGELHPFLNTITNLMFLKEHPRPEELVAARERDLPGRAIAPVWSRARSRADFYSLSRHDFDVEQGDTRSWRPRDQVLTTGALVVEPADGRLFVRSRDGRHRFDVIAFFEQHLIAEAFPHFALLPPAPHLPRVTIGRLVVQREQWRFDQATAASLATGKTAPERFLAIRRWQRAAGLPRHVFVRSPEETKPIYVDFDAPPLVELFRRMAEQASRLTVGEMLPGPDQLWLVDAEGRRYASELRLAVVDPQSYDRDAPDAAALSRGRR